MTALDRWLVAFNSHVGVTTDPPYERGRGVEIQVIDGKVHATSTNSGSPMKLDSPKSDAQPVDEDGPLDLSRPAQVVNLPDPPPASGFGLVQRSLPPYIAGSTERTGVVNWSISTEEFEQKTGYKMVKAEVDKHEIACGVSGCAYITCTDGDCKYAAKIGTFGLGESDMAKMMGNRGLGPRVVATARLTKFRGLGGRKMVGDSTEVMVMDRYDMSLYKYATKYKLTTNDIAILGDLMVRGMNVNLIHGDLHSDNILVSVENGNMTKAVYIDFGWSVDPAFSQALTQKQKRAMASADKVIVASFAHVQSEMRYAAIPWFCAASLEHGWQSYFRTEDAFTYASRASQQSARDAVLYMSELTPGENYVVDRVARAVGIAQRRLMAVPV